MISTAAAAQHHHRGHGASGQDDPPGTPINAASRDKGDCPDETTIFNVPSAIGLSSFSVNGQPDPDITLQRGHTYTFNVTTFGHPFNIKTQRVTGTGSRFSTGVTNNGTQNGTLTFIVPLDAPATLFYQCGVHDAMGGNLFIIDACVEEGEGEGVGEGEGEGEGSPTACHSADQDCNQSLTLTELLRFIQFFNAGALHCQGGTEDGFEVGAGDENCEAHSGDYDPQDWLITLSETLRVIQIFNSEGYGGCEGVGEDGFCV